MRAVRDAVLALIPERWLRAEYRHATEGIVGNHEAAAWEEKAGWWAAFRRATGEVLCADVDLDLPPPLWLTRALSLVAGEDALGAAALLEAQEEAA